jgi:UDP-N-acetylglucosamine 2-epimerase (non-hydrolysing)
MKKIISVVGARPNFMKVAPLHLAFSKYKNINHLICHTGQHYDEKMSKIFFTELGLPKPDFYLGIGSGSHAIQTAGVMVKFEEILIQEKPDLVIVVGDVNSTLACSLVAKKMHIPVAHVEAGLRSFDRTMPEEINRIVTDAISDYLFVSEESGIKNLHNEGVSGMKTFMVGNVMIDSLILNTPKIDSSKILTEFEIMPSTYLLATLHRPSNVDQQDSLSQLIGILNKYAWDQKVIFPVHPRTKANLVKMNLLGSISENLVLCDPIGYTDFLCLLKNARLVITDSGGIQEESTYLGVQCITLRENTERPITVVHGTNHLIGTEIQAVDTAIKNLLNGKTKKGKIPDLWDGKAAERICSILADKLEENNSSK